MDVGDRTEDQFYETGLKGGSADLSAVVIRHEVAHSFDHVASVEDSGVLMKRRDSLAAASARGKAWLRGGLWKHNPVEIIAAHVGNQYLANSGLQLQLALSRIKDHPNALGWFLFNVDLMADRPAGCDSYKCASAVRLYKETPMGSGKTEMSCAALERDEVGRVTKLTRFGKGCGSYTFAYKDSSMTPVSYTNEGHTGDASSCVSVGVLSADRTRCGDPSKVGGLTVGSFSSGTSTASKLSLIHI